MALISRLPSGGNDTGIKSKSLIFTKSMPTTLKCSKDHKVVCGEDTLVGIITASCDCVFDYVMIISTHQSYEHQLHPDMWYEIRDEKGNTLCAFNTVTNNLMNGYGENASRFSAITFKEGCNYLYANIGSDVKGCGSEQISFTFNPISIYNHCLSATGEAPTLTWTAA